MSTTAFKKYLSRQVEDLGYEDADVRRVLVLIANKAEARDDHFHQALERVFHIYGQWKFGSLYEKDFRAEVISACGQLCPEEVQSLSQPADQQQPQPQPQPQQPSGGSASSTQASVSGAFKVTPQFVADRVGRSGLCRNQSWIPSDFSGKIVRLDDPIILDNYPGYELQWMCMGTPELLAASPQGEESLRSVSPPGLPKGNHWDSILDWFNRRARVGIALGPKGPMVVKSTIGDMTKVVADKIRNGCADVPKKGFTGANWGEMVPLTLKHHFERFPFLQAWADSYTLDGAEAPWNKVSSAAASTGEKVAHASTGDGGISHTQTPEELQRDAVISESGTRGFCSWDKWVRSPSEKTVWGRDGEEYGKLLLSTPEHFERSVPMDIPSDIIEHNVAAKTAFKYYNRFFMMLEKGGQVYRATDQTALDAIREEGIHKDMAAFLSRAIEKSRTNDNRPRTSNGMTAKYKDCQVVAEEAISAEFYRDVMQEKRRRFGSIHRWPEGAEAGAGDGWDEGETGSSPGANQHGSSVAGTAGVGPRSGARSPGSSSAGATPNNGHHESGATRGGQGADKHTGKGKGPHRSGSVRGDEDDDGSVQTDNGMKQKRAAMEAEHDDSTTDEDSRSGKEKNAPSAKKKKKTACETGKRARVERARVARKHAEDVLEVRLRAMDNLREAAQNGGSFII